MILRVSGDAVRARFAILPLDAASETRLLLAARGVRAVGDGVALNSTGHTDEALEVLEANQARHQADRDTLLALVTINRDGGHFAAALTWADRLVALDPQARTLRDEIARLAGEQR